MVEQLLSQGAMLSPRPPHDHNVGAFEYTLRFFVGEAIVRVELSLKEWQTTSDVVITNITTVPVSERSKGSGSQAIARLIAWARHHRLNEIRAAQVNNPASERFWVRNGFVRCAAPNPTSDFVLVL